MTQQINTGRQEAGSRYSLKAWPFRSWCWMIIIASFTGFVVEDIFQLITKGYANNRNMYLPFLIGYGLAILGLWLFIGEPAYPCRLNRTKKDAPTAVKLLAYLLFSFVFVCVAEICLGYAVHMTCGFDYWNYTNYPLHITKYTSVFTSLGFAAIITLFMYYVFPRAMSAFAANKSRAFNLAGIVLLVLLVIDYFLSFGYMYLNQDYHKVWTIRIR